MQKHFLSILALFLCTTLWAADKPVTSPADIPAYYASVNGKSGNSLYTTINTVTNVGFSSLGYDGAISAYQKSDVYPTDPNHPDYVADKAGKLWDMYGNCSFTLGDECGNYKGECDCYNREHSIPKSWWGGGKNNMYSDIFHLVPTDGYVNNRRSAYAFGEVENVTYTYNGCKLGSSVASVSTDKSTILGTSATCSGTVFEPRDEYKGDFARGYLGMIAKYSNSSYSITSGNGGLIFESFSSTQHFGLTRYGVVLLMKWHREDPVSQKEIDRNNGIQKTQGNRNPFIDYPYLAEYIWGEKAGQAVDMSQLIASCDPTFVPGVSSGWKGEDIPPTPPTPTVKYGVTWSICDIAVHTDSIEENAMLTVLPETPVSCSSESPVFKGWTNAPIDGISDDEPAVLHTRPAQFPVVTADVTYYAVFAKETIVEGTTVPTDVTFDFNNMGLSGEVKTPLEKDGVTITFDKASAGTAPTYYTGSPGAIRLYAGGTMTVAANAITKIGLTFGASDKSNEITANTGSFTSPTWTGEADQVIFTVGGSSGHRRFATAQVTINGSGSTLTYSRFITSCQQTTEIEPANDKAPARKILVGGQIYLQVGEKLYNLQGQRVK